MSHVAAQETVPGAPMYKDVECLMKAAEMLGGELVKKKDYTWFGHHVGDYPMPKGIANSDLGHNAVYVFRLAGDKLDQAKKKHGSDPYEIGFMEDPNNKGCFVPIYDFWGGGYGLEEVVGKPYFKDSGQHKVQMLCPKLKQYYDMVCDAQAAAEVGDQIEFLTAKDAYEKYPNVFPESTDVDTWVSVADTKQRIGV